MVCSQADGVGTSSPSLQLTLFKFKSSALPYGVSPSPEITGNNDKWVFSHTMLWQRTFFHMPTLYLLYAHIAHTLLTICPHCPHFTYYICPHCPHFTYYMPTLPTLYLLCSLEVGNSENGWGSGRWEIFLIDLGPWWSRFIWKLNLKFSFPFPV